MMRRRFMTDLNEAREKGYITKACHFNSVFNYLEMEGLTAVLQEMIGFAQTALPAQSGGGLHKAMISAS